MWWILEALFGLYVLGILAVVRLSLHPPRIPLFCSPGAFGVSQESVVLESGAGIQLPAWWCEVAECRAVAVLAHGYVMNRSELAALAVQLGREGISSLLFDFRAHGASVGGRSTVGAKETEDVDVAVRFARDRCPGKPLILIGSSMGAAAIGRCSEANSNDVKLLVLDSAYSRLDRAVPGWWRFVGGPILQVVLWPVLPIASMVARIKPKQIDVAVALRANPKPDVLLLHGTKDDLATPWHAERNLEAAGARGKIVWFDGCGHSEGRWVYPDLYWQSLRSAVDAAIAGNEAGISAEDAANS